MLQQKAFTLEVLLAEVLNFPLAHFPLFAFSNTKSYNYDTKLEGNLRIFCFDTFMLEVKNFDPEGCSNLPVVTHLVVLLGLESKSPEFSFSVAIYITYVGM